MRIIYNGVKYYIDVHTHICIVYISFDIGALVPAAAAAAAAVGAEWAKNGRTCSEIRTDNYNPQKKKKKKNTK